ncbi:hypothetical protein JB92DRAFT_2722335 [Gautieria morchelliformis]|nr:hypothetical protein JB92DRAFT_2722335 [Gautieria morchelliformis]
MSNIRNSPLWFDDGNIVLTTASSAFKVHGGILERHSTVFKDLLCLPQVDLPFEVDGTRTIRVDDEPRDLEHFLLALYDGLYFDQPHASNFPIISGVLRLSIKYLVEYLRLESLKLLQHDWPANLTAWDLREKEAMGSTGSYESSKVRPHPIFIINLAHELGPACATLLPAALYDLSRYNCSNIWIGYPSSAPNSPIISAIPGATRLSTADLQTVMNGKEASQTFIARFLRHELDDRDVAVLCENRPYDDGRECRNAFSFLAHEVYRGIVGVTPGRDSDPLFTLGAAVLMQGREVRGAVGVHSASRACEQCRAEFAQVALAARRYVWNQIPRWFGLENVVHCAEGH